MSEGDPVERERVGGRGGADYHDGCAGQACMGAAGRGLQAGMTESPGTLRKSRSNVAT